MNEENQAELKRLKAQRREEYLQRIPIEGKFGQRQPLLRKLISHPQIYPEIPHPAVKTLMNACQWVHQLATWYNDEHRHSGIHFATPNQRHRGEDQTILQRRQVLYLEARQKNPQRWC